MAEVAKKKHTDQVRIRFLQAMDFIVGNKINGVTTKGEFAKKVGEYQQNFTPMTNGERYPTIESCCLLCDVFGISADWLFLNRGDMHGKIRSSSLDQVMARLSQLESKVNEIQNDQPKKRSKKSSK